MMSLTVIFAMLAVIVSIVMPESEMVEALSSLVIVLLFINLVFFVV